MSYLPLFIVTASFALQLISIIIAIRLLQYVEKRTPALLLLLAACLMAIRRSVSLFRVLSGSEVDLFAEIVACMVSFVLLAGFLYLTRVTANLHREMSKRSEAEKNLRDATAKLQALIYAIPDIVVFKDVQGRHLIVNKAAEEFIGMRQDELAGRTNEDLLPPDMAASCRKGDEEAMRSPKPVQSEEQGTGKNGRAVFLDTIKVPIHDEKGNLHGLVSVSRDITDRKRDEETLGKAMMQAYEEKARSEAIISALGDEMVILDRDFKIIYQNKCSADRIGDHFKEHCYAVFENRTEICEGCQAQLSFKDGLTHRGERLSSSGNGMLHLDITASPLLDESGSIIAVVEMVRDMSDRKAAEQALRISEERLSKAQKIAHVGNWEKDAVTGRLYWSEEVYRIYGVDPSRFVPTREAVRNAMHPDDRATYTAALETAITERRKLEIDYRVVRPRGEVRTVHIIGEVSYEPSGTPVINSGTVQDITEQKAVEEALRTSHEQLEHLNRHLADRVREETEKNRAKDQQLQLQSRQAAMGEMIDNIAHQWRQPLNNLGLIVQGVQKKFSDGCLTTERMQDQAKIGMSLIRYMSQTIDDFTNFFRDDKAIAHFKVKDVVATALSFMETSLKRNAITVNANIGEDIGIRGYRNEYTQVVVNLLNNARDIFVERGIRSRAITLTAFKENRAVVLTIADNGGGISDELMDRIFLPYFTSKAQNKGTGIGLYMSKMIIEKNMNGKLSAQNNGEGAEFRIEIQDHD